MHIKLKEEKRLHLSTSTSTSTPTCQCERYPTSHHVLVYIISYIIHSVYQYACLRIAACGRVVLLFRRCRACLRCRPGLRRFLAQAATMFEMTIYTAGTSQYADAVRFDIPLTIPVPFLDEIGVPLLSLFLTLDSWRQCGCRQPPPPYCTVSTFSWQCGCREPPPPKHWVHIIRASVYCVVSF